MDTGTGSLTVLKRTTSAGSCAPMLALTERPASVVELPSRAVVELPCDEELKTDVSDAGESPPSVPPPDSTSALKFCSTRLDNFSTLKLTGL